MSALRIATYNLLHDGQDEEDRSRLDAALEVLREAAPHVVMLQEARRFEADGGRLLLEVERRLGMRGWLALAPHTGQNTAVLVAPPIEPRAFAADPVRFHHAAAHLTVALPGLGPELTLVSVHLSPASPAARLAEAAHLADLAATDRFSIVAGDCNSPGPGDPEPGDWERLPAHFRVRYLDEAGERSDRRALRLLAAAGFADAATALGAGAEPTVPTTGHPDAEFVDFRADRVLVSPPLADGIVGQRMIRDERTHRASDHYPVVVDLDLPWAGA